MGTSNHQTYYQTKNEKNVEGDIEKGAGCDRSIPLRFKYGGTRSGKLWLQNYRSYHEL